MLRKLQRKDAANMLEWMHDSTINCHFRTDFSSMTEADVNNFIETSFTDENVHFAFTDESDNYLGTVSLKNISTKDNNAEYAIVTRKSAQGTGAAFYATVDVLKYAFQTLNLHRVYLNVLEENEHANNFYKRFGFVYEGTFMEHIYINHDELACNRGGGTLTLTGTVSLKKTSSPYIQSTYKNRLKCLIKFVNYDETFLKKSFEWLNNSEIKRLTQTPNFTEQEQKLWYDSLTGRQDYFVKGILFNKTPIGVVGLKHIDFNQKNGEYFGYIGEKKYWGKGIGKLMIDFIENKAKVTNLDSLYLKVVDFNKRAIKLYLSKSFKPIGQVDDTITMQKAIN